MAGGGRVIEQQVKGVLANEVHRMFSEADGWITIPQFRLPSGATIDYLIYRKRLFRYERVVVVGREGEALTRGDIEELTRQMAECFAGEGILCIPWDMQLSSEAILASFVAGIEIRRLPYRMRASGAISQDTDGNGRR